MKLKSSEFKNLFQTDESKFLVTTGLKFTAVSLVITIVVGFYTLQMVRLNYSFFKAHGYSGVKELEQAYYDYVFSGIDQQLLYLFATNILLFLAGTYIAKMLLRPFKNIGVYCSNVIEKPDIEYQVDQFSDYRMLTRFSDFFFEYLRDARAKGEFFPKKIPAQYQGIHKPILDKTFLFHFCFILIIISIANVVAVYAISVEIYESTIILATEYLKTNGKILNNFFSSQHFVIDELLYLTLFITVLLYFILAIHLYSKVSGAAFGVFATMRSFIKGNYFARVHLVGFAHIRDQTRQLNKYLDFIQDKLKRN
jgi:hypothetical protein